MKYQNVQEIPAEGFGLSWYQRPSWAWPTPGAQRAIEVRTAKREMDNGCTMRVYSVLTDQGFYWSLTTTDGTWRLRDEHVF